MINERLDLLEKLKTYCNKNKVNVGAGLCNVIYSLRYNDLITSRECVILHDLIIRSLESFEKRYTIEGEMIQDGIYAFPHGDVDSRLKWLDDLISWEEIRIEKIIDMKK
jgi:hypothetical protein